MDDYEWLKFRVHGLAALSVACLLLAALVLALNRWEASPGFLAMAAWFAKWANEAVNEFEEREKTDG